MNEKLFGQDVVQKHFVCHPSIVCPLEYLGGVCSLWIILDRQLLHQFFNHVVEIAYIDVYKNCIEECKSFL